MEEPTLQTQTATLRAHRPATSFTGSHPGPPSLCPNAALRATAPSPQGEHRATAAVTCPAAGCKRLGRTQPCPRQLAEIP